MGVAFINTLVGLRVSLIHFISINFLRSYDYRITIILIIKRFSFIISNLIIYSYNEKKSIETIIKKIKLIKLINHYNHNYKDKNKYINSYYYNV